MYNNKYNYDKFRYVNAKTASIIICPIHGEFLQKPDHHTRKNAKGCPQCLAEYKSNYMKKVPRESRSRKLCMTKETFILLATNKFSDKFTYDISDFKSYTKGKIRIYCKIHGWFEKTPVNFMNSSFGCTECGMEHKNNSKTKSYDNFVHTASNLYNNSYSYPESNRSLYKNRKSIIDIYCNKHGTFKKSAQKHLSGQGCFRCRLEEMISTGILCGGYSNDLFNSNDAIAKSEGILYYMSFNGGKFFKIGITTNLARRISNIKNKGKDSIDDIKVVSTYSDTLENVFYLEQMLLTKFKSYRFSLGFSTELFNKDISDSKIFTDIFINPVK